ncbi:ATP synthase subunit I [Dokdonella sp.]|uniref:ATP synthase subunit I n=1 Tax=Dokdonella sp. TaxID=2291710 RepID=UPI0025BEFD89|nr:ATP synthase subunit I [Dokdonella sp.]
MRNSIAHGKSVAWRTVALQLAASVVAALLAAGFGWRDGLATLVGGFLVSFGNGLFALRMYARGVTSGRSALRSVYAAEMLKWLWLGSMLYLAIAVWKLPFPGLIAGILAAQFAFWIALLATR